jgi:hypothetical protein
MLNDELVVFLSCSEKFRADLAVPVRDALRQRGIRAIIVSEEPRLPRTDEDPSAKVDAYLDAADALVALCTPDDELKDGTVQCRSNITDEIERARSRPHLRHHIQVFKEALVKLPSNLNPTYEPLDLGDTPAIVARIMSQLQAWGKTRASDKVPVQVAPAMTLDALFDQMHFADHEEASRRVYDLLRTQSRQSLEALVDSLRGFLRGEHESEQEHKATTIVEAVGQLEPALVSVELIEELAAAKSTTQRMVAAVLLWDRAEIAPEQVPLGILGRLALPAREDWYVQAPAMGAAKQLLLKRRRARIVFDQLASSPDSEDRFVVATSLLDVATFDADAVPHDLAAKLARDEDNLVAAKARELLAVIGDRPDDYRDPRSPFGL